MHSLALLNMKGGVGKTTMSINMATGFAMQGKRTLLIDLDPQSNTTSIYLDKEPDATISELLKGEKTAAETAVVVDDNLWLIPAKLDLANTEMDLRLQNNAPQHNRLQKAIVQMKDRFDFCVIDCPPIINLLTVNAIMASNLIVVPIKPDRFALQGFGVTVQNIMSIRENWELDLDYKILFTIVNRNNEEKEIISQLREMVKGRAFETEIRSQPKPIAGASARGKAVIMENDPRVGVAEDMRRLVDEIMGGVTSGK